MAGKVLVTDYAWADLEVEKAVLKEIDVELIEAPDGEEATLTGLAGGVCGILTCWAQTTRRVIEAALPDLRVISRYGVGVDNIDVAVATERGVPVAYVPDYCMVDVAEHAMSLLLALARKVARYDREIRKGAWDLKIGPPLRRLSGRTLGLVGFGRNGRQVAIRAKGFGLRVISFDPILTPEMAEEAGIESVGLDDLLAASDYISIHCPSIDATRGMINAETLRKMKSTACVINTSRGDIVNEADLADALEAGEIAGAALDVRHQEPPEAGDRLIRMAQVVHTPHASFCSEESLHELRERTAWEARRVLTGEEPENLVNPDYKESLT